ncbi:MAG TPA: hypothetical protein VGX02_01590, partial [Candidatus Eremiobacteraceae bacterium]|nr:hypothetical protein [Candidatus Eremiobacteraceae bacterium]
ADLVVNANTVARAYRELERDGVIETMAGRGSFVAGTGSVAGAKRAVADVADQAIAQAVREGKSMGLSRDEMKVLFEHTLDRWYPHDASEENAAS